MPAETVINELPQPLAADNTPFQQYLMTDDLYCMGSVHDAQGRVITAGGTRRLVPTTGAGAVVFGIPYLTIFDGPTKWTRSKEMIATGPHKTPGRWYPTLTRLPNGRIMITGGLEQINHLNPPAVIGTANRTIETFDPATGGQEILGTAAQTPEEIHAKDYTATFVLPYASAPKDVLMFGDKGVPILGKSTASGSWVTLARARPGPTSPEPNYGSSTVQLPLRVSNGEWGYRNGSTLTISGPMHTAYEHQGDVFDPTTATWRLPSIDTGVVRHHPSTVLLPDSRVLIVNGHDMHGTLDAQQAQYVNPRNGFSMSTDPTDSGVTRGYHSVAVLLPDGRVFTGGGRDLDTATSQEKPSYQLYTPRYPTGEPPLLIGTPTTTGYGKLLSVTSVGPKPKELVLIGLGSMTHSSDMGQRMVELNIGASYTNAQGAHLSIAGGPVDRHVAPPGSYLMFAVSEAGVPSAGSFVRIS